MLTAIFIGILIPPIWLSCHVIRRKGWPLVIRLLTILVLFVISQIYTIDHFVFGNLSGPEMPSGLLLVQGTALAAEIICFLLVFLLDFTRCIFFCMRKFRSKANAVAEEKDTAASENLDGTIIVQQEEGHTSAPPNRDRRSFLKKTFVSSLYWACPIVGVGLGERGAEAGIARPEIHAVPLALSNLPPQLRGFRIAHVSDIHIATLTTRAWLQSLVESINAEDPDIVCITGDLADGLPTYRSPNGFKRYEVAASLANLSAPLGVWACTGNHEYYSDYTGWMHVYADLGINFLHDTATCFKYKGANLVIAGRDDQQADRILGRKNLSPSRVFYGQPEAGTQTARIMLDHRPWRCDENAAAGCTLQLSGHTHGGQCLGMDRLVAMANRGYVRGVYTVSNMRLYVNSGACLWNGFPIRLGVPAEVAIITLM